MSAVEVAVRHLSRAEGDGRAVAPVRIVHLGLGAFFRAHQAWYTDRAPDADRWGIAAFAGRSADLADRLGRQDGLYTLVTRSGAVDEHEVVSSLSAVHAADDHEAWRRHLSSSEVAVVTLTVTEAGYRLDDERVRADLEALRGDPTAATSTVPGRLVGGLLARRAAGAGPLAVVPNDNLPDNGSVARHVVREAAAAVDPTLPAWVDEHVSFVTTVVDRITPRSTDEDALSVRERTGRDDLAPVVTEPFSEWVLSGEFPAGRPAWEAAGARFVDDTTVFEQRKLWLLNGSHSLLAYAGGLRGHRTVAEAVGDPTCRLWVQQWWDEACRHLALPAPELATYRTALMRRFSNSGIRHLLEQIGTDGSQKLPVRVLPVLRAERAAGRLPEAAVRVLASWVLHLQGLSAPVHDAAVPPAVLDVVRGAGDVAAARAALAVLDPALGADDRLVHALGAAVARLRP